MPHAFCHFFIHFFAFQVGPLCFSSRGFGRKKLQEPLAHGVNFRAGSVVCFRVQGIGRNPGGKLVQTLKHKPPNERAQSGRRLCRRPEVHFFRGLVYLVRFLLAIGFLAVPWRARFFFKKTSVVSWVLGFQYTCRGASI